MSRRDHSLCYMCGCAGPRLSQQSKEGSRMLRKTLACVLLLSPHKDLAQNGNGAVRRLFALIPSLSGGVSRVRVAISPSPRFLRHLRQVIAAPMAHEQGENRRRILDNFYKKRLAWFLVGLYHDLSGGMSRCIA